MGLKAVLATVPGKKRMGAFVLSHADEDEWLNSTFGGVGAVLTPAAFESLREEMPRLSWIGLGPKTVIDSPRLVALLLEAHILGKEVISGETARDYFDPRVETTPDALAKALIHRSLHQGGWRRVYSSVKSALEPFIAAAMLLFLSPILLAVAALIKLTSPGPVLYKQTRLGKGGREFGILKFRSMRIDAEKNGPMWASSELGDSRLTSIGGFLRASHLDELPQLINVLLGQLSFVGPRPERPFFTEQLEESIPLFSLRTYVKPGITGWAQVNQGYANSVEDSRRKLEYDLYYILNQSPTIDLSIVLATLGVVTSGGTEGKKRMAQSTVDGIAEAPVSGGFGTQKMRGVFLPTRLRKAPSPQAVGQVSEAE